MKEFEVIVLLGYTLILSAIAIFIIGRYIYFRKTRQSRISIKKEKRPFNFFRYLSIVAIPIFIIGFINYVFIIQKANLFAPYWAKAILIFLLLAVLVTEIFYNINLRARNINRTFNIIFAVLLILSGLYLIRIYTTALQYPSTSESVVIDLPFKGKWITSGAGATSLTNHHDRIKSQKYAIDIIRYGENNKLFRNEGVQNNDSYTFGAEIYSPVNGIIVHVTDSLPDKKITERDKLAGNHIIIQFQDTLYVALAHLQQNSIKVKKGDIVQTGDLLALVGNSGNTDFPHLHIHVQNSATYNIETTKSYPFRFRKFKRMRYLIWTNKTNEFLLSNDIIKFE